jgi:NitT/TauT family transport system substrate-binding protein
MGAVGLKAVVLFVCSLFFAGEIHAERIRTAVPQANLNYLSIYVADGRGYFREQELENETVVIPGPLATAALLSCDIDYSGSGGSGIRAAIKGAPIKGIMFQTEKVTFYLVTDPTISRVTDLKGKRVAVGNVGDSQDHLITMLVERAGLSAKDVTRIAMGADTNTRVMAVKSGTVQAATVDAGGVSFAEQQGLRTLAYLGDLFPFPFQGFVATEKKIRENPGQVKRWLTAVIRALMFVRDNPEEAVGFGLKKLQLGNLSRATLVEATKRYIRALPQGVPGLPSAEGIKNFLEYDIKIPMRIEENIAPERLLYLKLVEEVKRELESKPTGR